MNRQELLSIAKPILFNTEMVKAILEGRKKVTRRIVKPQPDEKHNFPLGFVSDSTDKKYIGKFGFGIDEYGGSIQHAKPPFKKGDYLYVRETWCWCPCWYCGIETDEVRCDKSTERIYHPERHAYGCYGYRASFEDGVEPFMQWYPSIHMPKEAARIFLKVIDVRVERLQDITEEQAKAEGIGEEWAMSWWKPTYSDPDSGGYPRYRDTFVDLWNSTIKTADLDKYGWDASPWVWVIEFERVI